MILSVTCLLDSTMIKGVGFECALSFASQALFRSRERFYHVSDRSYEHDWRTSRIPGHL